MEKVKHVLDYIKLYTGCDDYTLKRIGHLLETFVEVREVVKIVERVEKVYVHKVKSDTVQLFGKKWLELNDCTYEQIATRSRDRKSVALRNQFCEDAYARGFGYSEIGRYLKKDHATIVHSIRRTKTKKDAKGS